MAFVTISHWTATEMSNELMETAKNKFMPMIMSVGANGVQMIRTGELTVCVVTQYVNAATAQQAQAKIAEIREQVAEGFPMKMDSAHAGEVFGSS